MIVTMVALLACTDDGAAEAEARSQECTATYECLSNGCLDELIALETAKAEFQACVEQCIPGCECPDAKAESAAYDACEASCVAPYTVSDLGKGANCGYPPPYDDPTFCAVHLAFWGWRHDDKPDCGADNFADWSN